MRETKIRWSDHTWNAMVGCTEISPGCDRCYARAITERFRGKAFPNGFDPTYKPQKLAEPGKILRKFGPQRIFVNSLSDVHHDAFTWEQIASIYDTMLATPEHDYLVLTKRPDRMAGFMLGRRATRGGRAAPLAAHEGRNDLDPVSGWLAARGLDEVPPQIWLGTSIENDRYTFRADWLRLIPATVRFLSLEPLLGPVPSLDLDGIGWAIVGGESGPGYRPMDHDWARDIRDRCDAAGVSFFFKQSAAPRTEMGIELDGRLHEEYPLPHPGLALPRTLGRYVDAPASVGT